MHRHWGEVSAFSRCRPAFAASTQQAREAVADAVAVHGAERVIRTHALAAAYAAKGRIPPHYYARMFYGSGFAARMAALDEHDAAARATLPTRAPERDEESIGAFVVETLGGAPPTPLPRHESLPAPRMASVASEAAANAALPADDDAGSEFAGLKLRWASPAPSRADDPSDGFCDMAALIEKWGVGF